MPSSGYQGPVDVLNKGSAGIEQKAEVTFICLKNRQDR